MNAMTLAHNLTKAHNLGATVRNYKESFSNFLAHSHKVEKQVAKREAKYLITHAVGNGFAIVDIRNLPTFSATRDVIKVGVDNWAIKGNVRTRQGWNIEAYTGHYLDQLNDTLGQWVNFADVYKELCLLLEFNGNLYRLIK